MTRLIPLFGLLLSLVACASDSHRPPRPKLPYDSWYVGLAAPRYMEVWVERVDVLDQRKIAFYDVHGGVAGYTRKPEGWHKGGGKTMPVNHVDLPLEIVVRWQSLVEPQAYWINVRIPQWVRDEMVKPERVFCTGSKKWKVDYRKMISLGMAPGGIVKAWVGGACLEEKEIGRYQANVEPKGPYQGESLGKYVPLEPENKAYVEKHGIPYGSW
jgi:hypothetical protein